MALVPSNNAPLTDVAGASDCSLFAAAGGIATVAVGTVLISGAVTSAPVTAPVAAVGGLLAGAGAVAVANSAG